MDDIPTRITRAAQDWFREAFGHDATVVTEVERLTQSDGSIQSDVEVCCEEPGMQPKHLHCMITLEPNGTISCFSPDAPGAV